MRKNKLRLSIQSVLGLTVLTSSAITSATVTNYEWNGIFTFLDPNGEPVFNSSQNNGTKGANNYQDFISGTLAFDDVTGTGSGMMAPFDWGAGSAPMEAPTINLQAIGDGMGGSGTLIIGNMLLNWNGTYGFPVSVVLDAAGFFGATSGMWSDGALDQSDVAGFGAVPASDGTYAYTFGYLDTGPVPMATTEWNLTAAFDCGDAKNSTTFDAGGGCMGNALSGVLPLVTDTAANQNELLSIPSPEKDGVGIGGVPIWDGPFQTFNFNIDITDMTATPEVPVPAAVWLFGSGLLGLIGVARRKKCRVLK